MERVVEWQSRPLEPVYPIVYLDCIVVKIRQDYKAVTADLKQIYQSATEQEAALELERFAQKWDDKYPQISWSWKAHWPNLITLFDYPAYSGRS